MSIYTNIHDKYGSPEKVAEFRLFLLNDCYKTCEGCFYKRSGNKVETISHAYNLALELKSLNYELETCYLLPTDFFENRENIDEILNSDITTLLNEFEFLGIASTMEGEIDFHPFSEYMKRMKIKEVELQINIVLERLFEEKYKEELNCNITALKQKLRQKLVVNLALNLGMELTDAQLDRVYQLIKIFSDDGIIEINFTFLYNDRLSKVNKQKKLLTSLRSLKQFSRLYNELEPKYNERTLLKKPAFFFMGSDVYISPIIPFDEYSFIKDSKYKLNEISYTGFLEAITGLDKFNIPVDNNCDSCENFKYCLGKRYFVVAHEFKLPCFLGV